MVTLPLLITSVVLALFAHAARGHYVFSKLQIGDGPESEDYEFIRAPTFGAVPLTGTCILVSILSTSDPTEGPQIRIPYKTNAPPTDIDHTDLRCHTGGDVSNGTSTAVVNAGDIVTWITDSQVYHPGPVSVFMSRVQKADTADGSDAWFKIHDIGPKLTKRGGDWSEALQERYPVTIPHCLPSGEYLMRMQQVAIHMPNKPPQWHVACAQLIVSGPGTDSPLREHMVQIPGGFKQDDPGLTVNIYMEFKKYEIPGGKVWKCGESVGGGK